MARSGSSPRVRGKPWEAVWGCLSGGLIPARAGKTCCGSGHGFAGGAHPRACGENPSENTPPPDGTGSSPRVRGKPTGLRKAIHAPRLIPARAGKTRGLLTASDACPAHPRACGENSCWVKPAPVRMGSSPRVRGKPRPAREHRRRSRLIPARAGKTASIEAAHSCAWAHPRACGENLMITRRWRVCQGSSPRVRGKPPD